MRVFTTVLLCVAVCCASALDIGQSAPALTGVVWVKGEAAEPKGVITVVEFWATWCGPCRKSIPHLSELQKRYGDKLHVIGLSNEDAATVKPFVAKLGDDMNYRVGLADQAVHQSYMEGVDGIPHAFVVDATGTVVWAGHPMEMDRPLQAIIAGTYDVKAAKAMADAQAELEQLLQGEKPDLKQAKQVIGRILGLDPVNQRAIGLRIAIARHEHKPADIRETLSHIPVDQLDGETANGFAWERAVDPDLGAANLDLALVFVRRAMTLEPKNAAFVDTYARVLYALGLLPRAISEEERAVKLDPTEVGYAETLAQYQRVQALQATVDHPAIKPLVEPAAPTVLP